MKQFNQNYKGAWVSESYKVSFKVDDEFCSGYIIDKFRDIIYVETNITYGTGITKRANPIAVDFYLIYNKELNITYNVRCNLIVPFKDDIGDDVNKNKPDIKISPEDALG